jgi:hypothetical protein
LKKRYIDKLTEILDRKRDYKANTGIRRADGYQRMEEITIMKMKCIELKHFILNTKNSSGSNWSGPTILGGYSQQNKKDPY